MVESDAVGERVGGIGEMIGRLVVARGWPWVAKAWSMRK